MGKTAPSWYDEHLLDIRLPNLYEEPVDKKKKASRKKKNADDRNENKQVRLFINHSLVCSKNENVTMNGTPVERDHYLLNLKLDPAALRITNEDLLSVVSMRRGCSHLPLL